jgi:hypothetical protein
VSRKYLEADANPCSPSDQLKILVTYKLALLANAEAKSHPALPSLGAIVKLWFNQLAPISLILAYERSVAYLQRKLKR